MTVYFIGAGPGAPDLLTIRARDLLGRCPVCIHAGSLVPPEIVALARPDARLVNSADLDLKQIVAEMATAHGTGLDVARLCSGDPSIYSAVHEQADALERLGIPYEIVPGVPAFAAAAAALKCELTIPGLVQTVILARTAANSSPIPPAEDLAALGASRATLAIHLSAKALPGLAARLVPLYGAGCPAAVVAFASRPQEQVLRGTLSTIAEQAASAGVLRTAMLLIGWALDPPESGRSALYGRDGGQGASA